MADVSEPPANAAVAEAAGLTYADDTEPGFMRRRSGTGWGYRDLQGKPIRDPAVVERIDRLAIPPAYADVWICPDPTGHIQATGRDEKGRKLYRYHPRWAEARAETKYARMGAFGRALPAIRARVDKDLARRGLPKEKVVAAVVRLLERTLIRVGNDVYARTNKSFGLTTLRDKHVHFHGAEVQFDFKGKSGVKHSTGLKDRRLAKVVKACQDVPGQRLFQYYDEAGARQQVESADVNAYLREITGEDFTAKDFRTWAGTTAAAKALAMQAPPATEREAKASMNLCVKATAGLLGNTAAVCRSAYIHPEVLKAFRNTACPRPSLRRRGTTTRRGARLPGRPAGEVKAQTGLSRQAAGQGLRRLSRVSAGRSAACLRSSPAQLASHFFHRTQAQHLRVGAQGAALHVDGARLALGGGDALARLRLHGGDLRLRGEGGLLVGDHLLDLLAHGVRQADVGGPVEPLHAQPEGAMKARVSASARRISSAFLRP